jgi:hypothetical protein
MQMFGGNWNVWKGIKLVVKNEGRKQANRRWQPQFREGGWQMEWKFKGRNEIDWLEMGKEGFILHPLLFPPHFAFTFSPTFRWPQEK